ncbi:MAG TPA: hypothetical protein VFC00_22365 [Micromonosporaceae bacterium]|nr:hypothetical protein [Micromonosporaceae bacterium]
MTSGSRNPAPVAVSCSRVRWDTRRARTADNSSRAAWAAAVSSATLAAVARRTASSLRAVSTYSYHALVMRAAAGTG